MPKVGRQRQHLNGISRQQNTTGTGNNSKESHAVQKKSTKRTPKTAKQGAPASKGEPGSKGKSAKAKSLGLSPKGFTRLNPKGHRIKPSKTMDRIITSYLASLDPQTRSEFKRRFGYKTGTTCSFESQKKVHLFVSAFNNATTLDDMQAVNFIAVTDVNGHPLAKNSFVAASKNRRMPKTTKLKRDMPVISGKRGGGKSKSDAKKASVDKTGIDTFVSTLPERNLVAKLSFEHGTVCKGKGVGEPTIVENKSNRLGGAVTSTLVCTSCNQTLGEIRSTKASVKPYPAGHSLEHTTVSRPYASARPLVIHIIEGGTFSEYKKQFPHDHNYNSSTYQTWVDLVHRHTLGLVHEVRQFAWELEVQMMTEANTLRIITIIDSKWDYPKPHGKHCINGCVSYRSHLLLTSVRLSSTQRARGYNRNPMEDDKELTAMLDLHACACIKEGENTYGGTADSMDFYTAEVIIARILKAGLVPQFIMDGK